MPLAGVCSPVLCPHLSPYPTPPQPNNPEGRQPILGSLFHGVEVPWDLVQGGSKAPKGYTLHFSDLQEKQSTMCSPGRCERRLGALGAAMGGSLGGWRAVAHASAGPAAVQGRCPRVRSNVKAAVRQ